jgi:broad specificity phosphatase PhoE
MNKNIKRIPKRCTRIRSQVHILCTVILVCFCINVSAFSADSESDLWGALKSGGHVALLRHALAPGTGDPPEFRLGQCTTQRNLSDEGRDQAREIGDRFRENGIYKARIYSSQWCRCLETATLLELGQAEHLAALNSFFRQYERRESQTKALLEWLGTQDLDLPIVLVTHQVNITALTGIYPDSGELVVVHRSNTGEIRVIGTIETR